LLLFIIFCVIRHRHQQPQQPSSSSFHDVGGAARHRRYINSSLPRNSFKIKGQSFALFVVIFILISLLNSSFINEVTSSSFDRRDRHF